MSGDDDSLDHQSDDQEHDISMSDDDEDYWSSPDEQSDQEDDDVSMPAAAADDAARYHEPGHGDLFKEAIRIYSDRGFHSHAVTFPEFFYFFVLVRRGIERHRRRSRMFQQAADEHSVEEDAEDNPAPAPAPAHAPPAAASEAAIAALEAAEAPSDDCCPVCLQQEEHGASWRRVVPCGHRFHAACVARWLRVKLSCPVCRRPAAAACCRRDDDAAAEPGRSPLPAIVEEAFSMSIEEFEVFKYSARWMEFQATYNFDAQSTGDSSGVSAGAA